MAAGAPDRLAKLVDQILTRLPNALLVVATIIPFPGASRAVDTFNAAIPSIVKTRADAGVHPNQAGYERMAGVWYTAIRPYLR
jgi:hypothetical protein